MTVFFRGLLILPQLVVLAVVGYAVGFVTLLAWFFALITGRNPFHNFVVGYLGWSARVSGYGSFLTDDYPPFSLASLPDYPIHLALDEGPLGRLTVFFRIVLSIPVVLLSTLASVGMGLVVVVAWFFTLFRGSLPESLHSGFEATLRYHFRVQSYILLVQNAYPKGLFGDVGAVSSNPVVNQGTPLGATEVSGVLAAPADSLAQHEAVVLGEPTVTPNQDAVIAPSHDLTPGFLGALPKAPPLMANGDARSGRWPLVVSKNGRRIIIAELLAGVAVYVGYFVLIMVVAVTVNPGRTWSTLYSSDISTLKQAVVTAQPDFTASPTKWVTIAADCTTIGRAVERLNTVPQYPVAGPNVTLLQGVRLIVLADRACISTIVPKRLAHVLPRLARAFSTGSIRLTEFLGETP